MSTTIVPMCISDYDDTIAIWQAAEGVGLSDADSRENIAIYLERNPGMSFVAREDGKIVGAVLCGHDGRRGYLHHLAVEASRRKRGIGAALAARCIQALRSVGIAKCHLFVFHRNDPAFHFWSGRGWADRADIRVMSFDT